MKLKVLLKSLFGDECKDMKEFAKFVMDNETLLMSYPEEQKKKVLSYKFPDSAIDQFLHIHHMEIPMAARQYLAG